MADRIFYLQELPRLLKFPFKLRSVSLMKDHIYFNRNRTLHVDLISISFNQENRPCKSLQNGILQELNSNSPYISIIPKGTKLHTLSARRHEELIFTFVPEDFEYILNNFQPVSGAFRLTQNIQQIIDEIIENMECMFIPGNADRMDMLFLQLLREISLDTALNHGEPVKEPVIFELISYLNVHFTENITLENICKKYSISMRTLYRYWNKSFEDTPADFLLKKRLRYAEHLLLTTDMGIQDIARSSGFDNPIYFTQCFRRKYNISPGNFRKNFSGNKKSDRSSNVTW